MDKQQKEKRKSELTQQLDERIVFLQSQIDSKTREFNTEVQKLQEEIEVLTMQSSALNTFKIK